MWKRYGEERGEIDRPRRERDGEKKVRNERGIGLSVRKGARGMRERRKIMGMKREIRYQNN